MLKVIDLIDSSARDISTDITMVMDALMGVYESVYRTDPSARGLNRFMAQTQDVPATGKRLVSSAMTRFQNDSLQYRNAFDPSEPSNLDTQMVVDMQVYNLVEQARLVAARKFRAAVVSRRGIAAPRAIDLRVMNRAGAKIKASDAVFLLVRKAFLDLFNEAQLTGLKFLAENGIVVAPEGHPLSGKIIDVIGNGSGASYEEVQTEWFHPRSSAVISRIL